MSHLCLSRGMFFFKVWVNRCPVFGFWCVLPGSGRQSARLHTSMRSGTDVHADRDRFYAWQLTSILQISHGWECQQNMANKEPLPAKTGGSDGSLDAACTFNWSDVASELFPINPQRERRQTHVLHVVTVPWSFQFLKCPLMYLRSVALSSFNIRNIKKIHKPNREKHLEGRYANLMSPQIKADGDQQPNVNTLMFVCIFQRSSVFFVFLLFILLI